MLLLLSLPLHLSSCSTFPFKMKLTFISLNQIVNPTTRAGTLLQFAYFLCARPNFLLPFPEFFCRILSWHFPLTSCWKCCANSRCFWQSLRNFTAGNAICGPVAVARGHLTQEKSAKLLQIYAHSPLCTPLPPPHEKRPNSRWANTF